MKRLLLVAIVTASVAAGLFALTGAPSAVALPLLDPQAPPETDLGGIFPSSGFAGQEVVAASGWSTSTNVSDDAGPSGAPVLGVDSAGTVHMAWYDNTPGNWEILYKERPAGGEWPAIADDVSANSSFSLVPSMIIDGNDGVHIAWQDYGGSATRFLWQGTLLYKMKELGQDFAPPEAISATSGFGGFPEIRDPSLLVDAQHTVHLIWAGNSSTGYRIYYADKPQGGAWGFPLVINPGNGDCFRPRSVVDANGVIHVIWQEALPGATTSDIFYAARQTNGVWTAQVNVSHNAGNSFDPWLALANDGSLLAVWRDYTINDEQAEILLARKPLGAAWTEPLNVSNTPGDSAGPMVVEDAAGTLHLVWFDNTTVNWEIFYASKPALGSWTSGANVSQTPGRSGQPYILYDRAAGELHLAWADDSASLDTATPEFDVFYASKSVPAFGASYKTGTTVALAGDSLAYTLVLRNPSASPVTVSVSDSVPLEATYIPGSGSASAGSVVETATGVTWTGTIAAGGQVRITIGGRLSDSVAVGTIIYSRAIISDAAGAAVAVDASTRVMLQRASLPLIVASR